MVENVELFLIHKQWGKLTYKIKRKYYGSYMKSVSENILDLDRFYILSSALEPVIYQVRIYVIL